MHQKFSRFEKFCIFAPDLVRRGWISHAHEECAPRGIHNKSDK